MQMTIVKQIGKNRYTFLVEGSNLYEVVTESQKLSFPDVFKCKCGSDNLILASHLAQSYKYTEVRCLTCKAQVNFGQRKDDPDTFFLRKTEDGNLDWQDFKPKDNNS